MLDRRDFIKSIISLTAIALLNPLDTILSFNGLSLKYHETDWRMPVDQDAYVKHIYINNCLSDGRGVYTTIAVSGPALTEMGVDHPRNMPQNYYNSLKQEALTKIEDLMNETNQV